MPIKFDRILWILPNSSGNLIYESLIKGIEMLGATVSPFYYREEVLCLGITGVRNRILKAIDEFKPDLVLSSFYSDTYELSPEFLREISSKAPLVVFPSDDKLYGTYETVYFVQSADAVMTEDPISKAVYDAMSIPTVFSTHFIRHFINPLPTDSQEIDVSFVGDCEKADRSEFIQFLRENGINVSTFGLGSENGFVSRMEMLKIMSMSKINLNFSKFDLHKEVLNVEPWRGQMRQFKGRPVEIAQMKSFCLSEFSGDLESIFTIGSEVDAFHDKEELLEKVKYYLGNDAKREEMASRAFERVKRDYEDQDSLRKDFNLLHEKLHKKRGKTKRAPVFRSFEFNVSEVKSNFFIFVKLLQLRRYTLALGTIPYFLKFDLSSFIGLWRAAAELTSKIFFGRK